MTTYTLDPARRRSTELTVEGGSTRSVDLHYVDGSDSPGWARLSADGQVTTTRYVESLSGALSATLASSGTSTSAAAALTVTLTNPHGDIVASASVPSSGPAAGIDKLVSSTTSTATPYPPLRNRLKASGVVYGWLGGHERAAQPQGFVLMGARVYNSVTGQFTSRDPLFGGNSTTYAYPQDPMNSADLTGTSGSGIGTKAVYNACRDAGFGILKCGKVVAVSAKIAGWVLIRRFSAGKDNATRHFTWMVYLSYTLGRDAAWKIAKAHEKGSKDKQDSIRDTANNQYSLGWYDRHKKMTKNHFDVSNHLGSHEMDINWFIDHALKSVQGRLAVQGELQRAGRGE
ncbi:hypothetical protein G5V59_14660 [Nocardioides sp. W3-2-3]|uniref:DUF6973 domain-containing protein n=1 Tax=Nocardioides convexus TaxID=2712224 RepID=UPI002418319C|nr:hypothetical protein [Nocardioides convexus]NHA00778.1 hypothetical protein [Nocardioides convexus]